MLQKQAIINNLCVTYYQSDVLDKDKTVVFLHGWGSEGMHLKSVLEKCDNYIALDLPGFGKSEPPKSAWSLGDYADFLKSFLEKIEVGIPVLVGHSFGGSIIIKHLSSGNSAKKAILISPSGIRKKGLKVFLWKMLAKIAKTIMVLPGLNNFRDDLRRNFYRSIDAEDYIEAGRLTESYKKIIREDLSEDMKKIDTDVALVWGESDKDTPLEQGRAIRKLIKNSRLRTIENAGHFSFLDQPEKFNKIFFEEIDAN